MDILTGGARNLLSLPGDHKDNDGWGDDDDQGATADPILRVSHNQSRFMPGSLRTLTLIDCPLLDADGDGEGGGGGERTDERQHGQPGLDEQQPEKEEEGRIGLEEGRGVCGVQRRQV